MGRKRTESAQCKVAEKCASRVRVRGRETRNAMEQCGARIAGREEGVVTAEEGEGFAVQACRERQCQCACGRRVGWRCGSSRCVKSHRVPERNCCAAGHASFGREFRTEPIDPSNNSRLPFDSVRLTDVTRLNDAR